LDNTLQGIETSTVMSNNRKAAKQATHYFLKNGKKNIGVISHPLDSTLSLRERYKGYELALAEYNISVNSHHILDKLNHYDIHSTKKIIHFINNNPNIDALLAFNYELGIKTINTTLNNSVHLTYKDIIIFDEEFADIYNLLKIKIKYIQQDAYAIGETACQIILNQFNSPTYLTQHITIDTKLFV
jgi:DNA-binding LacI/PurR family transcriptional regulator